MAEKNKKLEILDIRDITKLNNTIFSKKTNHYLKKLLFNLRVIFRYNSTNLEDLIDLYYYIESLLNEDIDVTLDEIKLLIYRLTDTIVNIEEYDIHGETILTETIANLQQSLYMELERFKLALKSLEDQQWESIIDSQIMNTQIEFEILTKQLESKNINDIKLSIEKILQANYPYEYATYKSRKNYLDY
ncbi:hypothetical protein [Methanosphaera sp. WGK6]|uniref:hypothetical protein n=1 Tax=Methanosphaera sp. WGK6 TaxID=1561964 RepID=UPI00084CAC1F|nr:hypothetical protein [Methanosphaera sp. WGK6]OED29478.1 hypothetical protein NL43_08070 [Methanosphaera sp. WGK6]